MVFHTEELSLRERSRVHWAIVRCRICGVVAVDPQPTAESAQQAYTAEGYGFARSHRADIFLGGIPYSTRVLAEIETRAGKGTLLDVGCATGEFLLTARARGWAVHGIEVSPHAAAVAHQRGLRVSIGTLAQAHLAPNSFDAVTMLDVIEHVSDPLEELKTVHRLLRPGGVLCLETPNWNSVYRHLLGRRWAAMQPRLHLFHFDAPAVQGMLRRAGFDPIWHTTEIVALLSPEGAARGFGPAFLRSVLRDFIVRGLLRWKPGRLDRLFLRIGPAARAQGQRASFSQLAEAPQERPAHSATPPTRAAAVALRAVNAPLDRFFLKRGMGEQLRVYARRS